MPHARKRSMLRRASMKGMHDQRHARKAIQHDWDPPGDMDPAAATDLDRHNMARQQSQEAAARASSY